MGRIDVDGKWRQVRVRPLAHICLLQVSLKQPHTYSRNSGTIQFGLTLDHKAPTGFGRAKEVRVYSCIVDLVQRTTSKPGVGKENGAEEEARGENAEEDRLKENEVSLRCESNASR